jgi:hypothetical protein
MAVVLTSATRQNPAPCQHFIARIDAADLSRTVFVSITVDELTGAISDDDFRAVLRVWARYHTSKGKTLGQLVGQTIFAEIP